MWFKKYQVKTLFLSLTLCLTAVSSQAALIEVTTTADQNGEDDTSCSLREAIKASLSKEAFGGCVAGEIKVVDIIQLKDEAVYQLNSELEIRKQIDRFFRSLRIVGPKYIDPLLRDDITGVLNKRLMPLATIKAATGKRVFDTTQDKLDIRLDNVIVEGSNAANIDKGGIFRVGGGLSLNNVVVKNGSAKAGGAIFLDSATSSLNMNNTVIENNTAQQGSFLSQTCFNNLNFDRRRITLKNSSIVNNTFKSYDNDTKPGSILYACAAPIIKVENTTFAANNSGKGGALIDFVDVVINRDSSTQLSVPELSMEHVTLVGNANGLRYTNIGTLNISKSIIAYNDAYDCKYDETKNNVAINKSRTPTLKTNLFTGDASRPLSNHCQLNKITKSGAVINDSNNAYTALDFGSYFELSKNKVFDFGLGLKGYLPKIAKVGDANADILISDIKECDNADKRGLSRKGKISNGQTSGCYKGSLERARLILVDDKASVNTSYSKFISSLETQLKQEASESLTDEQLTLFKDIQRERRSRLNAFNASYTKKGYEAQLEKLVTSKQITQAQKAARLERFSGFRQAYVSIFSNDIPYERVIKSGEKQSKIDFFPILSGSSSDLKSNYTVTVLKAGTVGGGGIKKLSDRENIVKQLLPIDQALEVNCYYDDVLQQLVISRTSGVSSAGSLEYCEYKVTHTDPKTKQKTEAIGLAAAFIANVAPVAKNVIVNTSGDEPKVKITVTDSINDDGDGPFENRPKGADGTLSLPEFYGPAFIEVVKAPELGRLEFSGASAPCPNNNASQVDAGTCYSGEITYVRDNVFSEFDDSFTYRVYDGGSFINNGNVVGAKPSNIATVFVNANRRNGAATPVLKGGGAINIFYIFGLLGLFFGKVCYLRYFHKK